MPSRHTGFEVRPATFARFNDVATMLGPKNPDSSVCWCLSHRLDSKTNRELVGPARGEYVKKLCRRPVAPGVLAYQGVEVVGWAAVAPRSELPFARSTKIPHLIIWRSGRSGVSGSARAIAAKGSRTHCWTELWRMRGQRVRLR